MVRSALSITLLTLVTIGAHGQSPKPTVSRVRELCDLVTSVWTDPDAQWSGGQHQVIESLDLPRREPRYGLKYSPGDSFAEACPKLESMSQVFYLARELADSCRNRSSGYPANQQRCAEKLLKVKGSADGFAAGLAAGNCSGAGPADRSKDSAGATISK